MGQDVEPVFLTLRPIEYLSPTRRWLAQIVDDPQVHCALGPNDKGCLARDLNVSVYFDDYKPDLSAVRGRAGARCYLVDASYNQHVTASPRVKTDPAQWKAALDLDISRRAQPDYAPSIRFCGEPSTLASQCCGVHSPTRGITRDRN